jgi:hypothetical protein
VVAVEPFVVDGRWEPCVGGTGPGRRTAAFGLKADFLFNILSLWCCPAGVVDACQQPRRSRALPGQLLKKGI